MKKLTSDNVIQEQLKAAKKLYSKSSNAVMGSIKVIKPYNLPGTLLSKISVFDLKPGAKVYDKASNKEGVISDVKETSFEVVEAFIKLEGQEAEVRASTIPHLVYVG